MNEGNRECVKKSEFYCAQNAPAHDLIVTHVCHGVETRELVPYALVHKYRDSPLTRQARKNTGYTRDGDAHSLAKPAQMEDKREREFSAKSAGR